MIQNLSPSQQFLGPNIIPLEKDEFQISYMEKVDTEDSSLYKEHFSSSLLAEKENEKADLQFLQNFAQNHNQYFSIHKQTKPCFTPAVLVNTKSWLLLQITR